MMIKYCLLFLTLLSLGCQKEKSSIESLSFDYPHGETRLLAHKDGSATLYYGALPNGQIVKKGIFNARDLYEQFKGKLYKNTSRENWPNPNATSGMVQIKFADGHLEDYLLFDEEKLTNSIFNKARKSIVE